MVFVRRCARRRHADRSRRARAGSAIGGAGCDQTAHTRQSRDAAYGSSRKTLFPATKLEAFHGPGRGDVAASHDLVAICVLCARDDNRKDPSASTRDLSSGASHHWGSAARMAMPGPRHGTAAEAVPETKQPTRVKARAWRQSRRLEGMRAVLAGQLRSKVAVNCVM